MAENSVGSPIFADRYRFQPVGNDWDTGRSGFTHLVFDIQKERLGVMKRAELKSQQAVDNLKNEVAALLDLQGEGVPELYDTGEAEYGSKKFFYIVIEYIDGIRVGKKLEDLTVTERADILLQFWSLLTTAQRMGIVNGDIDLKHLFWRRDKKQLVVIDWGNAKLNNKPNNKSDFAFDLARAAEITYTLVSRSGRAPVSGSLTLPKDVSLMRGLAPVPPEFRTLCKWAPRTPSIGMQPSHLTAPDLFEATKKWFKGVPYEPIKQVNWGIRLVFIAILVGAAFLGIWMNRPIQEYILSLIAPTAYPTATVAPSATFTPVITTEVVIPTTDSATSTLTIDATHTSTPVVTPTDTPMIAPTLIFTEIPTIAPTISVIPSPGTYTNLLMDTSSIDLLASNCWENLQNPDGFSQQSKLFEFRVGDGKSTSELIETNFGTCTNNLSKIKGVGVNAWIKRLEIARTISGQPEDGREFGIFVENLAGQRREYTIWMDKNYKLQLRVRESGQNPFTKELVAILSEGRLEKIGNFPNASATFPIQIVLEINNQGLDILYLKEGPKQLKAVNALSLSPAQMGVIEQDTRPTFGEIVKIGLIGYGGETQAVIWPLVFFTEGTPQP